MDERPAYAYCQNFAGFASSKSRSAKASLPHGSMVESDSLSAQGPAIESLIRSRPPALS